VNKFIEVQDVAFMRLWRRFKKIKLKTIFVSLIV